jgi:hypothetical protein
VDSQKVSAYAIAKLMLAARIRRVKDAAAKRSASPAKFLREGSGLTLFLKIPQKGKYKLLSERGFDSGSSRMIPQAAFLAD